MAQNEKGPTPYSRLTVWGLISVCVSSAVWGAVVLVVHLPDMLTSLHVHNHRPERFVLQEVVHEKQRRGRYSYVAKGRIQSEVEEIGLNEFAPGVESYEGLEKLFGQRSVSFAVMCNPNRTGSIVNEHSLRGRPLHAQFVQSTLSTAWWALSNRSLRLWARSLLEYFCSKLTKTPKSIELDHHHIGALGNCGSSDPSVTVCLIG